MKFGTLGIAAGIALGTASALLITTVSAEQPAQDAAQAPNNPDNGADGFPDLVSGLRAVEGVLGVEVARTSGGKNVIFTWFEDKAAAKRWYYSDMHRGVMEGFANMAPEAMNPMEDVPDNVPILCIASVTPATQDKPGPGGAPFSQIAIELYTTLPGGIALGGSFSPDTLKVKGLERY
ncbi:MAG: antibiotic biosynthesis monooxygenase [Phycisphaerales bacterium]